MTTQEIKRAIREKGFMTIPKENACISPWRINEAIVAFFNFLALPQGEKESILELSDPTDPNSTVGYVPRDRKKGDMDTKEYFHYHLALRKMFGHQNPVIDEFLHKANVIHNYAVLAFANLLNVLEADYPGIENKFMDGINPRRMTLRFLRYEDLGVGNFIAQSHYDYGTATLRIGESAPGLFMSPMNSNDVVPVREESGTLVFFPGRSMHLCTDNDFPPTWHGVEQMTRNAEYKNTARWAIVAFFDLEEMHLLNGIETKKRITNWEFATNP